VLFHKEPSRVEVLNDRDREIVKFLPRVSVHYEELIRYLRHWPPAANCTSSGADRSSNADRHPAGRAFFYLQKNSFGGLIVRSPSITA